jgi:hypothetical protein
MADVLLLFIGPNPGIYGKGDEEREEEEDEE